MSPLLDSNEPWVSLAKPEEVPVSKTSPSFEVSLVKSQVLLTDMSLDSRVIFASAIS